MKMPRIFIAFLLSTVALSNPVWSQDYNEIGKRAYASWDCAAYGYLSNSNDEIAEKLFMNGYELLTVYIQAAIDGELTPENTNEVPVGISWAYVAGPTIDFSLGHMWAQFMDEARNNTWPDSNTLSYNELTELQQSSASQKFRNRNCEIVAHD